MILLNFFKGLTRESFGKNISQHVLGRNVVESDLSVFDVFLNEVMTNVAT